MPRPLRPTTGVHEPTSLNEQQLLHLVVVGRETRTGAAWELACAAWRELAARYSGLVLGWVAAFEFPEQPGVRIPAGSEEDAAQEAFERAVAMLGNFRGVSLNEFRAALRTCTKNACMDHCRRVLARARHQAGSINETVIGEEGADRGRFDSEIGRIEERREGVRSGAREDLDVIARTIDAIGNADMQTVLRRTMERAPSMEIAAELSLTISNVDQLRRRGIQKLKEALQDD
ncbi:MAG: RNA polymerase sigma factor [Solirubrobacteraceae bacterium]